MSQIIRSEQTLQVEEIWTWVQEIPQWPAWLTGRIGSAAQADFYTTHEGVTYNLDVGPSDLDLYQVQVTDDPDKHRLFIGIYRQETEALDGSTLSREVNRILDHLPDWLMEQVL